MDFGSKLLYRQMSTSDEGHEVASSVHALTWRHPSSTASITTRARMTIVSNFNDSSPHNIVATSIEVWKENGWISFEDCFDETFSVSCACIEDIEKKCLEMLELFFVGRLSDSEDPQPFDPGSRPAPKRTKPAKVPTAKTRTSSTKTDYNASKGLEPSNIKDDKKEKEEPDFEWI